LNSSTANISYTETSNQKIFFLEGIKPAISSISLITVSLNPIETLKQVSTLLLKRENHSLEQYDTSASTLISG
jgi:hypothetical protein